MLARGWKKTLKTDIKMTTATPVLATVHSLFSTFFSSVQFSLSVLSNSLWLHEPQHTRPPCPSPTPGVYPSSCPLSWWCHLVSKSLHYLSQEVGLTQHCQIKYKYICILLVLKELFIVSLHSSLTGTSCIFIS